MAQKTSNSRSKSTSSRSKSSNSRSKSSNPQLQPQQLERRRTQRIAEA
jgi:hypothetical protein